MSKLSILLVILVTLIGLSACQPKPETAANAFFKALENQDFEAAKELSTQEGQQLLSLIQSFAENADEEQLAEMKNTKYKVIETKVEGDSAVVVYEQWDTTNPDSKESHELQMRKIDGDWKVHFVKNDLQK